MNRIIKFSIVCALSLQVVLQALPTCAQSWSAWKALAEEQVKAGDFSNAERSWRAAYQQITLTNNKDSRLYISALALARVLIQEKKSDEAIELLKQVSTDANIESVEAVECLKFYRDLCKEKQNVSEFARVEAVLEKQAQNKNTKGPSEQAPVSLLFGEAAKDDLYKKLGIIRQLTREKDYAAAERELEQAHTMATATHDLEVTDLVLREQGKLYCVTREYKKAEQAYRALLDVVKQRYGNENQHYVEVLGTHARLLLLLGEKQQAALEQARCQTISEKYKIISTGLPAQWSSSAAGTFQPEIVFSGIQRTKAVTPTRTQTGTTQRQIAAVAQGVRSGAPQSSGRLRVIEFFTTW